MLLIFNPFVSGGSAYCIGPQRQDCWFLYTMVAPQATFPFPEHTLEILMNELPEDVLSVFSPNVSKDGKDCRMVLLLLVFTKFSF